MLRATGAGATACARPDTSVGRGGSRRSLGSRGCRSRSFGRANGIAATPIQFSNYLLDTRLMQLSRDGVPIDLTPQEYKALVYLAHHRGQVVSQLELTEHIYNQDFERNSNSIEVLVGRLRRRLGSDLIKTRRGFGYALGDGY